MTESDKLSSDPDTGSAEPDKKVSNIISKEAPAHDQTMRILTDHHDVLPTVDQGRGIHQMPSPRTISPR